MKSYFRPTDACDLIGISYRQLQYWDRTGFISPSYKRRGKYRLYTFSDLSQLYMAQTLRQRGYSIQKLRRTLENYKEALGKARASVGYLTFYFKGPTVLMGIGTVTFVGEHSWGDPISLKDLRQKVEGKFPSEEKA